MSNTQNEHQKKWTETYRASLISVTVMLILLIAAVGCHLFGWRDAPFQFLAACLGAGVTVIITNLLLVEQTKQQDSLQKSRALAEEELQNKVKQMELVQIKETEQYKTKLRIYQEYLEKLCDVVRDRKLDTDEKIDMQFRTAYLAMHSDVEHIEQVSSSIKDIIGSFIDPSGDKYDVEKVQRALFNIVHQFRSELYADSKTLSNNACNGGMEDDKIEDNDSNAYEAIIKNFVDAFSPEGEDEMKSDTIIGDNANIWNTALERWEKDNKWICFIDGETIRLHRPYDKDIHVQFGFWKGHYYIQAKYHNFVDFSQALKWEYKGSKTYETWWNHLHNLGFPDIEEGKFMQMVETDENLQQMMVNWVDKLIAFINKWDIPAKRLNGLMEIIDRKKFEQCGWRFWIYDSKCVVCDSHLSAIGNPFIDTYNENSKISVRLGNRDKNVEMQKKIVASLGMPTDDVVENDTRTEYASFDKNTSDEIVMTKVAELIDKLSQIK